MNPYRAVGCGLMAVTTIFLLAVIAVAMLSFGLVPM